MAIKPTTSTTSAPASTPLADESGSISNRPSGEGTRQTEPRPEDMSADAKITSIASQLNTATEQVVGTPPAAAVGQDGSTSDLLASAQEELTLTQNEAREA